MRLLSPTRLARTVAASGLEPALKRSPSCGQVRGWQLVTVARKWQSRWTFAPFRTRARYPLTATRPRVYRPAPWRELEPAVSYYLVPVGETDGTTAHVDDGFVEAARTERWAVCTTPKGAPLVAALWSEAQDRERAAAGKDRAALQATADRALADLAREREWGDTLADLALGYATDTRPAESAPEGVDAPGEAGDASEAAFRLGVMYLLSAIDKGHEPRVAAVLLRPKVGEALRLGFQRRDELDLGR